MKPQSAKAKGRRLQQQIRDFLLELYPHLTKDDVRSTGMGQQGEDIQLSPLARESIPFQIECKNKREVAVINWLQQAAEHGDHIPIVVAKQDYSDPVVVIDAAIFFNLLKDKNGSQRSS